MSTIQIVIHTDNAAFQDGNGPAELARILGNLAVLMDEGESAYEDIDGLSLRDINGNHVGAVSIS